MRCLIDNLSVRAQLRLQDIEGSPEPWISFRAIEKREYEDIEEQVVPEEGELDLKEKAADAMMAWARRLSDVPLIEQCGH